MQLILTRIGPYTVLGVKFRGGVASWYVERAGELMARCPSVEDATLLAMVWAFGREYADRWERVV